MKITKVDVLRAKPNERGNHDELKIGRAHV